MDSEHSSNHHEGRNTAIDYINRDIVNIKSDIQSLSKLLRDGNGQPSLMQQVATLNVEIVHLENQIRQEMFSLKEAVTTCANQSSEKNKLSWHFKTAIFVALITSITSLISIYIQK